MDTQTDIIHSLPDILCIYFVLVDIKICEDKTPSVLLISLSIFQLFKGYRGT